MTVLTIMNRDFAGHGGPSITHPLYRMLVQGLAQLIKYYILSHVLPDIAEIPRDEFYANNYRIYADWVDARLKTFSLNARFNIFKWLRSAGVLEFGVRWEETPYFSYVGLIPIPPPPYKLPNFRKDSSWEGRIWNKKTGFPNRFIIHAYLGKKFNKYLLQNLYNYQNILCNFNPFYMVLSTPGQKIVRSFYN